MEFAAPVDAAQVKEMRETYKTCLAEREGLAQFLG